jgi:Tfp pilus assembly PilM family ATPase
MARHGRPIVCIDFMLDQLRVIEVQEGQITAHFVRPLPAGSLRSGDPVDPQVIGIELQQSMRAVGMEGIDARIALPDEAAVGKIVELPRMPDRHLRKAVAYAVERELPFPVDRAAWSWEVVARDATTIAVYLVAAWRDTVDRVAEVASSAGLRPTVIEPRAFAIARTFGVPRVTVLEASGSQLHLTQVLPSQAAYVDVGICPSDPRDAEIAIERLLQRSSRRQLSVNDLESSPVVLAGDLEEAGLLLSVPAVPLATLLNGHPPRRPVGMDSGYFLAGIGLAMRN